MEIEDSNISSNQTDIYFNKYIKPYEIKVYSVNNLTNDEKIEKIICPICFYVLKNPISCSDTINSHTFCKECIDKVLKESNKCPKCL